MLLIYLGGRSLHGGPGHQVLTHPHIRLHGRMHGNLILDSFQARLYHHLSVRSVYRLHRFGWLEVAS